MMKHAAGGCLHCGIETSVCWRRGPVDKPHLCNRCGVRFLVKKSLQNYWPGEPTPKTSASFAAKSRSKPRKPRSMAASVSFQDQGSSVKRRESVAKGSKTSTLSPAAQAAYAQLAILTKLEQHGMCLAAAAQPPLFLASSVSGDVKPVHWMAASQRDAQSEPLSSTQLLVALPGASIQVKEAAKPKLSLFSNAGASLRRRARKQAHVTRAAT